MRQVREGLRALHERKRIYLVAVDECHLVFEWAGFRDTYSWIGQFCTAALPGVRKVAVTATAPPRIRSEIEQSLHMHNPYTLALPSFRPNLNLAVMERTSLQTSLSWLRKELQEKVKAQGT